MDEKEILNQFGEMLISDVRTQTLKQLDKIFSGELKSEKAQKLHAKLMSFLSTRYGSNKRNNY